MCKGDCTQGQINFRFVKQIKGSKYVLIRIYAGGLRILIGLGLSDEAQGKRKISTSVRYVPLSSSLFASFVEQNFSDPVNPTVLSNIRYTYELHMEGSYRLTSIVIKISPHDNCMAFGERGRRSM